MVERMVPDELWELFQRMQPLNEVLLRYRLLAWRADCLPAHGRLCVVTMTRVGLLR